MRRAPIERGNISRFVDAQPDVAVNSAVKSEVGLDGGRDIGVVEIVHLDSEDILRVTEPRGLRHFEFKAGVAAQVLPDAGAVHPKLTDLVRALEFQEHAFAADIFAQPEMLAIPAEAAEIAGDFIAAVVGVPGVRQIDRIPPGVVIGRFGGLAECRLDGGAERGIPIERPERAAAVRLPPEAPSVVEIDTPARRPGRIRSGRSPRHRDCGRDGAEKVSSVHGSAALTARIRCARRLRSSGSPRRTNRDWTGGPRRYGAGCRWCCRAPRHKESYRGY